MNKIPKVSVAALAVCVSLAVGAAAVAFAAPNSDKNDDKKLVKTRLSIAYDPGSTDEYGQAKFSGRAKTKQVCRGNRKVTITDVGKDKTDRNGRYVIGAGSGAAPRTYQASIKKKVIRKKNGKKVICKKAKSPKVTIGGPIVQG